MNSIIFILFIVTSTLAFDIDEHFFKETIEEWNVTKISIFSADGTFGNFSHCNGKSKIQLNLNGSECSDKNIFALCYSSRFFGNLNLAKLSSRFRIKRKSPNSTNPCCLVSNGTHCSGIFFEFDPNSINNGRFEIKPFLWMAELIQKRRLPSFNAENANFPIIFDSLFPLPIPKNNSKNILSRLEKFKQFQKYGFFLDDFLDLFSIFLLGIDLPPFASDDTKNFSTIILLTKNCSFHHSLTIRPASQFEYKQMNAHPKCQKVQNGIPLVIGWTNFFGTDLSAWVRELGAYGANCPYKCEYGYDKTRENEAAIIAFHNQDVQISNLPKRRQQCQLYAIWQFESPVHTWSWKSLHKNYFNLTITYQSNSHVFYPHGIFMPRPKMVDPSDEDVIFTDQEIDEAIGRKKKLAFWVVSNCETDSLRELYVEELKKHMEITVFGGCTGKKINNEEYNRQMVLDEHFFYLSFENSVCKQYITEKFWIPLSRLTVPVILSQKHQFKGRLVPSTNFTISADEFANARELAEYLKRLANNKEEYRRYFDWTKDWIVLTYGAWTNKSFKNSTLEGMPWHPYCRLCELAYKMPAMDGVDFEEFWWTQGECISEFARKNLEIK